MPGNRHSFTRLLTWPISCYLDECLFPSYEQAKWRKVRPLVGMDTDAESFEMRIVNMLFPFQIVLFAELGGPVSAAKNHTSVAVSAKSMRYLLDVSRTIILTYKFGFADDNRPCGRCQKEGIARSCIDGARKKGPFLHYSPCAASMVPVKSPRPRFMKTSREAVNNEEVYVRPSPSHHYGHGPCARYEGKPSAERKLKSGQRMWNSRG